MERPAGEADRGPVRTKAMVSSGAVVIEEGARDQPKIDLIPQVQIQDGRENAPAAIGVLGFQNYRD